ncbi:MAG TPA: Trm112 family protein [Lacipirellulaceae bacterium]|nr:Trm112 family protein [Lacipirellulaceae bacterium]
MFGIVRKHDELSLSAARIFGATMDERLLETLRCPKDHSPLRLAESEVLDQVNAAIRAGQIRNQAGLIVHRQIGGGLVRAGGDLLYPIVDHIPVMLYDEAIPLNQLGDLT